jgi:hypothetical protein
LLWGHRIIADSGGNGGALKRPRIELTPSFAPLERPSSPRRALSLSRSRRFRLLRGGLASHQRLAPKDALSAPPKPAWPSAKPCRHAPDIDIPTQRVPINPQRRCLVFQVNLERVAGAYCFSTNAASALI